MSSDRKLPVSFSEPEAQRILARAAELEGSIGTRFTAEDLRQIAAKAGIEAHALEQAINETAIEDSAVHAPVQRDSMNAGSIATLIASGAVLGALAFAADRINLPGSSAIPVFAPSALFTLYLTLRHPVRDGLGGLLRKLALVFGSFTAAIAAVAGVNDSGPALTWALLCGTAASAILSLRTGSGSGVDSATPTPVDAR